MTDYFYTSKLYYAAAAIEQGFEKIETLEPWQINWTDGLCTGLKWRFPKTPHNVALMEVRIDDLVKYYDGYKKLKIGTVITKHEKVSLIDTNDHRDELYVPNCQIINIIYRDNKPFPVWDKEGV